MEEKESKNLMVVIDTSIFVDYLRNYEPAVNFFKSLSSSDYRDVYFSAITETELLAGKSCNNSLIRDKILLMLNHLHKIEITNPIALLAGDICRKNEIDVPDAILAASSIINKTELVTKNIKDFQNIEELNFKSPY